MSNKQHQNVIIQKTLQLIFAAMLLSSYAYKEDKVIEVKISNKYNWLDLHGLKIKEYVSSDKCLNLVHSSCSAGRVFLTCSGQIGQKFNLSVLTNAENLVNFSFELADIAPQTLKVKIDDLPKGMKVIKPDQANELEQFLQNILCGNEQFEPLGKKTLLNQVHPRAYLVGYFQKAQYRAELIEITSGKNDDINIISAFINAYPYYLIVHPKFSHSNLYLIAIHKKNHLSL